MEEPFTITSFAWRQEIADKLRRAGFDAPDEIAITATLVRLAQFLEAHGLTTRKLLKEDRLIGDRDFVLRSSDLTEQGIAVIRAGFGAWEKKGCPATDLRPLEKGLKKVTGIDS
jgi:hypothetical protein